MSSSERKAQATAEALDLRREVIVADGLREVTKPWFDDAAALYTVTRAHLEGAAMAGWEPERHRGRTAQQCLDQLASYEVVVLTHGTMMTAWLLAAAAWSLTAAGSGVSCACRTCRRSMLNAGSFATSRDRHGGCPRLTHVLSDMRRERDRDGKILATWVLDILDGQIQTIRTVNNPDKLGHLGAVADAWAALRETNQARRSTQ